MAKQCLVPFSNGNVYKDEILCDVVPMDACHLLIGRPWEFDLNSIHQGRSNTYSFKQGNKKITLTPLIPNQKNNGSLSVTDGLNLVLFLSEPEIIKEMQQEQPILILLSKEIHEDVEHQLPAEVRPLLEQYHNVIPAELSSGLPQQRGIEHQIDLVPGSVLPNIPAYRCDPECYKGIPEAN
ncbi:uncharacterized protein LOC141607934 [Silene latifolia]|uniref:uncharacterized protein LOC141607934 n=1 Tax=Silene latifolia TaxID=37657 RepID=UPI003D786000